MIKAFAKFDMRQWNEKLFVEDTLGSLW